jgi:hypothetical protein
MPGVSYQRIDRRHGRSLDTPGFIGVISIRQSTIFSDFAYILSRNAFSRAWRGVEAPFRALLITRDGLAGWAAEKFDCAGLRKIPCGPKG